METRNHIYKFEVDNKETGRYIKKLRKEKGWTAEELAEKLYCSPKTISSWETGVRMPSLDMLVYLSELFGVSVHSILLPCDNCSCDYIGSFTDSHIPVEYDMAEEGSNIGVARLYTREEYLLQRLMSGVFSEKDRNELMSISCCFDFPRVISDPNEIEFEESDCYENLLIKWIALRLNNSRTFLDSLGYNATSEYKAYQLFKLQFLFRKLYGLNDVSEILKSINVVEKSILLTTCVLCKKIRFSKFAENLYNEGGLLIRNSFEEIPSDIQDFLNNEPEYLNEYHKEKDFYVEIKSEEFPNSSSFMLKRYMIDYIGVLNYVTSLFYKMRNCKINEILIEKSDETYNEYLKIHKMGGK